MKLNKERNRWRTFSHQLKGAALGAVMIMGLSGTPLQANVNLDLEGCKQSTKGSPNGYALSGLTDADGIELYTCNESHFVDGNMFDWAELDRVPHRVIITNNGKVPEDFIYTVSGHFQGDDPAKGNPDKRGWNQITGLVLVEELSDPACTLIQSSVTQTQAIKTPGVEGAFSTIYRKIEVTNMPPQTRCVALFNAELALGAHYYTGATLHFYLLDENLDAIGGHKTVQVNTVNSQGMTKEMEATQDESHTWTVSKRANPTTVHFGDVCDENTPTESLVKIDVEWVKEEATPAGKVNITTVITATNNARRDLQVDLNDTIFNGTLVLDHHEFGTVTLPAGITGEIGRHTIYVDDTGDFNLKDEAVMTYLIAQPFGAPLTLTAKASTSVSPSGITKNTDATIRDHEWISSGVISYAATEPTGKGNFENGYDGYPTQGPVDWTSSLQSESGKATFEKIVSWENPAHATGLSKLEDKARLSTVDGFEAESNEVLIKISTSATFKLNITKEIPDILQGEETLDFNFTVSGAGKSQDVIISFAAGETIKAVTLSGLDEGTYSVLENPTEGFNPDPTRDNPVSVDLNLPNCSGDADFVNVLADAPKVKVAKITKPAAINGDRQDGGWYMELLHKAVGSSTFRSVSNLTTKAVDGAEYFTTKEPLPEGDYKIKESVKTGWFELEAESSGECEFTIDYPRDYNRPDIVCSFVNAKYAKIIVDKITKPSGDLALFDFTIEHGSDAAIAFQLADQTIPFDSGNLMAGTYVVTEADPRPEFDLQSVVCEETGLIPGSTVILNTSNPATIDLDWGETITCTYTNLKRGEVEVIKVENGEAPLSNWNFTLRGPGLTSPTLTGSIPPNPLTFDNAKLIPGKIYTLCETGVGAGWRTTFEVGTAAPMSALLATYKFEMSADNSDQCIDFIAVSNQKVTITVNNDAPGGEPRTIGYWKNWNTCTKGGQADTAAANGGSAAGFWLLNDVLSLNLGDLEIAECEDGVAILNKSNIVTKPNEKSKKRASDAAYGMAAQLLAAKANYAAGAETCPAATEAIKAGEELLARNKFDGTRSYLTPKDARKEPKRSDRSLANSLAETLDRYNNSRLCP